MEDILKENERDAENRLIQCKEKLRIVEKERNKLENALLKLKGELQSLVSSASSALLRTPML